MEVMIVKDRTVGGALVGEAGATLIDDQPDAVLGSATGSSLSRSTMIWAPGKAQEPFRSHGQVHF